ncbi:MAG: gliding motility-associated ABC transporter substrate-binding protein GldG [Bacteroidales bacterium]|nr:gliding motility-associated ABC transporter substrate-binding protein GldG [Bacteroidales bacterium]MBN2819612.1 gliding motility-associated ABC transporter substrate-binding protein GldG [Bacteroidales bacterium]
MNSETKHKKRFSDKYLSLAIVLAVILLASILSANNFFRIDLTSEKRYSLSDQTKEILTNLDDLVYIRVYLDGELNIPLRKFQKNITEMLEEFKAYAGSELDYEFTNPFDGANEESRTRILSDLNLKGLHAVNIHNRGKDGSISEKVVVPGAVVIYNGIEIPLNLLVNNPGKSGEENLNSSVESLEYTFISTIKNLTSQSIPKIALLEGHGEWPDAYMGDFMKELSKSYQVDRGRLGGRVDILDTYEALIIAGPVMEFSEQEKFIIDQYIMKGGKVMWILDAVNVDFDSLAMGASLAIPNNLNIEDMLFRYGVRINADLLMDAQCSFIPVNVALAGNPPNFQPVPWLYYPLISTENSHPITQNLNRIWLRFASSIDTIEARKNIKKTPLLVSSGMNLLKNTPSFISLSELNTPPAENEFSNTKRITAVLLEGIFESVFKSRSLEDYFDEEPDERLDLSSPTRMIIVSDADIIRNDVKQTAQGQNISPLGFDKYTNQTYGNKDFLVNAINFLTDKNNLLGLRGREFKIRLLNRVKTENERLKWQLINILAAPLFLILFGILFSFYRTRKYTR